MRDQSWNHPDSLWPGAVPGQRFTDRVDQWEISAQELKHRLDRGDPLVILDVRENWEADLASLPGARLIPLGDLDYRVEDELDRDEEIIVLSHHGVRSMEAAMTLWNWGFDRVKNLSGGIARWAETVEPEMPRY